MAGESEAAGLLRAGALYTRRLGLRPATGTPDLVFAGFKHGAFSLYFGDQPIYHFDLEGRWQRAFLQGTHYLKALDNSVDAIDRLREGRSLVLHRRALSFAEVADLDASVRAMAIELISDLDRGAFASVPPDPPTAPIALDDLHAFLDRITQWDAAAWFAHRERYLAAYGPPGFLPPEAQQAVWLQATLGHRDGLTFGWTPAAEPYTRSADEFWQHAAAVRALVGRRVLQAKTVYVAGSDLLHLPADDVAAYLRLASETFPIDPAAAGTRLGNLSEDTLRLEGVTAFIDHLEPPLPDRAGWDHFQSLGLRRVVVGVESGAGEVRSLYGKTWPDDALRRLVSHAKAAGLELSLVLLVGAGGLERAECHVAGSAQLLNALAVGRGDIVYLVQADELGGEPARDQLRELGLSPLPPAEAAAQQAGLLSLLAPLRQERGARVVPYSLEKQRM